MTLASGIVNDLLALDPAGSAWADLSGQLVGAPPSPRTSQGAASVGSTFYVFGGFGTGGFFAFRAKTLCPSPSLSLPRPPHPLPSSLPPACPSSVPPPSLSPSLPRFFLSSLALSISLPPSSLPSCLSLILASRFPSPAAPQQHRCDGSGTEQRNGQRERTANSEMIKGSEQ